MKREYWLVFLLFTVSLTARAGVYMGTASTLPLEYSTPDRYAPPSLVVPYAEALPNQGVLQGCEPYAGKGPMPAGPCSGASPEEYNRTAEIYRAPVAVYTTLEVSVHTGSLRDNIDRIVKEAGWGIMIWKPGFDYNWVGNVTVTANDIQGILTKLLEPYPLQAVFYEANHVVAIVPRRNT